MFGEQNFNNMATQELKNTPSQKEESGGGSFEAETVNRKMPDIQGEPVLSEEVKKGLDEMEATVQKKVAIKMEEDKNSIKELSEEDTPTAELELERPTAEIKSSPGVSSYEKSTVNAFLFPDILESDSGGELTLDDYWSYVKDAEGKVQLYGNRIKGIDVEKFEIPQTFHELQDIKDMGSETEKFTRKGKEILSKYKDINLYNLKNQQELNEIQDKLQQELNEHNEGRKQILPNLKVLQSEITKRGDGFKDIYNKYINGEDTIKFQYTLQPINWLEELDVKSLEKDPEKLESEFQDLIKAKKEEVYPLSERDGFIADLKNLQKEDREVINDPEALRSKVKEFMAKREVNLDWFKEFKQKTTGDNSENLVKEVKSLLDKGKKLRQKTAKLQDAISWLKELEENTKTEDLPIKIKEQLKEAEDLRKKINKDSKAEYTAKVLQNACSEAEAVNFLNLQDVKEEKFSTNRLLESIQDLDFEENPELWQENKEEFEELLGNPDQLEKILDVESTFKAVAKKYGELDFNLLKFAKESGDFQELFSLEDDQVMEKLQQYDFEELKKAVFDLESGEYNRVYDKDFTGNKERVRKVDKDRLDLLKKFANDLKF